VIATWQTLLTLISYLLLQSRDDGVTSYTSLKTLPQENVLNYVDKKTDMDTTKQSSSTN
jgi:hypothetical protein